MKRYFLYAIVLAFLGNALLSNASNSTLTNKSAVTLEQLGE